VGLLGLALGDLDLPSLELGADGGKLVLVEVVVERERLEGSLVGRAALLRLGQERLDWCFKDGGAQFCSLPSSAWVGHNSRRRVGKNRPLSGRRTSKNDGVPGTIPPAGGRPYALTTTVPAARSPSR